MAELSHPQVRAEMPSTYMPLRTVTLTAKEFAGPTEAHEWALIRATGSARGRDEAQFHLDQPLNTNEVRATFWGRLPAPAGDARIELEASGFWALGRTDKFGPNGPTGTLQARHRAYRPQDRLIIEVTSYYFIDEATWEHLARWIKEYGLISQPFPSPRFRPDHPTGDFDHLTADY